MLNQSIEPINFVSSDHVFSIYPEKKDESNDYALYGRIKLMVHEEGEEVPCLYFWNPSRDRKERWVSNYENYPYKIIGKAMNHKGKYKPVLVFLSKIFNQNDKYNPTNRALNYAYMQARALDFKYRAEEVKRRMSPCEIL